MHKEGYRWSSAQHLLWIRKEDSSTWFFYIDDWVLLLIISRELLFYADAGVINLFCLYKLAMHD